MLAIDLSDPEVYRDLSKPIGALYKEKLDKYKVRSALSLEKI